MNSKKEIKKWWAENPQTYGKEHGTTLYKSEDGSISDVKLGSKKFFDNVDKTFYEWNKPLHKNNQYFSKIFPYQDYKNKNVLEIGCGMGTMLMLWAKHGAHVTGVDLNETSVEQTKNRFLLYNLDGVIQQEDANNLSFDSNTFDFVYSWGVLHHSPNFKHSISEFFRVLKPGGQFGIMVYNRNSVLYRYSIKYLEGLLHLENQFLNELALASRYTDGRLQEGNPHTWPLTRKELTRFLSPYTSSFSTTLLGTELDFYFKLLLPGFGALLPRFIKKSWARRFGWSIWASGVAK